MCILEYSKGGGLNKKSGRKDSFIRRQQRSYLSTSNKSQLLSISPDFDALALGLSFNVVQSVTNIAKNGSHTSAIYMQTSPV